MLGIPWHFQSSIINHKNAPTKPGSRRNHQGETHKLKVSPKSTKIHREFSSVPKTKAKKNSKMPMGIKRACHSLHSKRGVCTRCGHMPRVWIVKVHSVGSQSLSSKTNKKAKLENPKLSFQCINPNKNHLSKSILFLGLFSPRPCNDISKICLYGIQTLKTDNMEIRPIAIFVQGDTDLEP